MFYSGREKADDEDDTQTKFFYDTYLLERMRLLLHWTRISLWYIYTPARYVLVRRSMGG